MVRKHERKSIMVRAWVQGDAPTLLPCVVEDMSSGGAKLLFERGQPPDMFKLYFAPAAPNFRNCQVRWREPGCVGVAFGETEFKP
jgi:hypothetical protein